MSDIASMPNQRDSVDVLIVEDSESDAKLLRTHLERSAPPTFRVSQAWTSAEAVDAARERAFDVALVDLGLPDARDLEAVDAIRSADPSLPLIVVSGRDDEELAADALYRGAEDYLLKGAFDRRLLLRAIRYAMERHRGRVNLEMVTRELREVNGRLESLLVVDPLTELLNRRGVERALDLALERIAREQTPHLALFVDLDQFKSINDRWGHAVGDVVLTEVASKIRETARTGDATGRVGGDEFVILMPGARVSEMGSVCERLRLAIASAFVGAGSTTIHVTACVAAIELTDEIRCLDLLLGRMHALLRQAKTSGRNCVMLEGGAQVPPATYLDSLCDDLKHGRGVYAVVQPIFRLSDISVCGFELLSRFRGAPTQGPDAVFRVCAERNMLAVADHQCLLTCVEMSEGLPLHLVRHVNIFPSTLMGLPLSRLIDLFPEERRDLFCLELSEQQMLGETRRLQERVDELRHAGLRIACDDVGFGRSQLESLVLLEPDVVKLDKRCIRGIATEERARRQLERFIDVGHKLGAEVVAEGIETEEDLEVLRDLGVDQGQGFLWGVPGLELPAAM